MQNNKTPRVDNNAQYDMAKLRSLIVECGVGLPEDGDVSCVMEDEEFEKLISFFDKCLDMASDLAPSCEKGSEERSEEKSKQISEQKSDRSEASKKRSLSPSLKPRKCSTAPEICFWAGSLPLTQVYKDLRDAVLYENDLSDHVVRKFATINTAYRRSWYIVSKYGGWEYPEGATGYKQKLPQPERGCKGLKGPWDNNIPIYDYVPMGICHRREDRSQSGRWFYPQQSDLRNEVHFE